MVRDTLVNTERQRSRSKGYLALHAHKVDPTKKLSADMSTDKSSLTVAAFSMIMLMSADFRLTFFFCISRQ